MTAPDQQERERTLELINQEIDKRIAEQAAAGASIDTKTTLILGFVVLGVQVYLGLHRSTTWSRWAFLAFGIAFALGLSVVALRKYQTAAPKPDAVIAFYEANKATGPENLRELTLAKLVGTKAAALKAISKQDGRKANAWWASVLAFGVAVLLAGISVAKAPNDQQHHGRRERPASSSATTSAPSGTTG